MDTLTQWLVFVIILLMMMWGLRWHFGRQTKGCVYYFGITTVGSPNFKLLPEKDGRIELPAASGKGAKKGVLGPGGGKTFLVSELSAIDVGYPLGLFRFLQVPVKMVIFYEWCWEPISNRSNDPLMSPKLLDNMLYEAKSGGWVAGTEAIEEQQEIIRKLTMRQQLKPFFVYTGLLIVIAGVGGLFYLAAPVIEKVPEIIDMLDKLGAGQGLW